MSFFDFFWASSNLRTTTSHFVVLQICFEAALTESENRVRPAARSIVSTTNGVCQFHSSAQQIDVLGIMKLSKGASSGITAFGSTNAPVDSSRISGVDGEAGFDAKTTFAKCVGTETLGGDPITS